MSKKVLGYPLVQVFSISIKLYEEQSGVLPCTVDADGTIKATDNTTSSAEQQQYVKLYGTIDIGYLPPLVTNKLYERAQENPELIDLKNGTISLSGPSPKGGRVSPVDLEMRIHLRDAHRNLEVSRGWLECSHYLPECYYNKRLSSIVRGEHGWAIVHHTFFHRAVYALVTVKLIVDGDTRSSPCVVFGSLYVRYGGHDYRYEYQRKYYRNVLFNKPPDAGESLDGNSMMLPLLASFVAVPMKTSLIIEGELHVKFAKTEIATLRNIDVEIPQPQEMPNPSYKSIVGENAHLEVTVSWLDV